MMQMEIQSPLIQGVPLCGQRIRIKIPSCHTGSESVPHLTCAIQMSPSMSAPSPTMPNARMTTETKLLLLHAAHKIGIVVHTVMDHVILVLPPISTISPKSAGDARAQSQKAVGGSFRNVFVYFEIEMIGRIKTWEKGDNMSDLVCTPCKAAQKINWTKSGTQQADFNNQPTALGVNGKILSGKRFIFWICFKLNIHRWFLKNHFFLEDDSGSRNDLKT